MGSLSLALVEVLLSVGVPPDRARAIVQEIDVSISERIALQSTQHASRAEVGELRHEGQAGLSQVRVELAGLRADLAEVRTELRSQIADVRTEIADVRAEIADVRTEIAQVRTEIAELRTEVRGEIAELRPEIARVKLDLTRWMLGAMTAQAALLLGAMKLMQSV
jgi:uncharacterized protein involved in exopolysaccharide biosynthesis